VNEFGAQWTKIGSLIGRTSYTCRACYKRLVDKAGSSMQMPKKYKASPEEKLGTSFRPRSTFSLKSSLPIAIALANQSYDEEDIAMEPENQLAAYSQLQAVQVMKNVSSVLANYPTLKIAKTAENEKRPWTKTEVSPY
jgi:hypothetical protein